MAKKWKEKSILIMFISVFLPFLLGYFTVQQIDILYNISNEEKEIIELAINLESRTGNECNIYLDYLELKEINKDNDRFCRGLILYEDISSKNDFFYDISHNDKRIETTRKWTDLCLYKRTDKNMYSEILFSKKLKEFKKSCFYSYDFYVAKKIYEKNNKILNKY